MQLPVNAFKAAIAAGRQQIGLWVTLPSGFTAEALATCGFDWLLFDTEHSVGDPITVHDQLQATAAYPVNTLVRPAANDPVLIKRVLDAGARSLIVPYVQTAEEAAAAVAAARYAPQGFRGVAGTSRASRFGTIERYTQTANDEICMIVQCETAATLDRIEEIAAVDGIDGIFIGPADLAATMGHPGDLSHPEVVSAVEDAIRRTRATGKPAGILTLDRAFARRCIELGSVFTAVDLDASLLMRGARALAAEFGAGG